MTFKKLFLGAGARDSGGYTLDIDEETKPDFVHDLNKFPYPFKNNEWDFIEANHVLEHLDNVVLVMQEIERILKPGGLLVIRCPFANSFGAFVDPTHKHYFLPESFTQYFCVTGDMRRIGKTSFGLVGSNYVYNDSLGFLPKKFLRFIPNGVTEFKVTLKKEVKQQ